MFWVDAYESSLGYENFSGFVTRFIENSKLYLSKHFFVALGLFSNKAEETNILLTILMYLIFVFVAIIIFKKRKKIIFLVIYLSVAIGITFVSQQIIWDQIRLILLYVPIAVLLFSAALYDITIKSKTKYLQILVVLFFALMLIFPFTQTVIKAKENKTILSKNISGDKLYGLTPDWKNYLTMCEWASENIPKDEVVACRKPELAYIYGNGREFFGIYKFLSYNIATLLSTFGKDTTNKYIALNLKTNFVKHYETIEPYQKNIIAFINQHDNKRYAVYKLSSNEKQTFTSVLNKKDISFYNDLNTFHEILSTDVLSDYAVYPDTLVSFLKKNHVQYMILANLRLNSKKNTGKIITTLYRYWVFIETKYPGTFQYIRQEGETGDEPAAIYKLNFDKEIKLNALRCY